MNEINDKIGLAFSKKQETSIGSGDPGSLKALNNMVIFLLMVHTLQSFATETREDTAQQQDRLLSPSKR